MAKRASEQAGEDAPKMGRPPRAGGASTALIQAKVTNEEKAQIEAAAEAAGLSLSDYVRARLFGRRVRKVVR